MNQKLPLEIRRLASSLFARDTGFSGPEIFEWFGQFSDDVGDYPWSSASSRWVMFEECLDSFAIERQIDLLFKLINYRGPSKYQRPSESDLRKLRDLIVEFNSSRVAKHSTLSTVNWQSVHEAWEKALMRASSDPEGSITSARSALESVCKHILERRGVEDKSKGDLVKLYKATAKQLSLSPGGYSEEVFRQILGSCAGIASGLAGLRNAFGDSHGKDSKYVKPKPRHARLAINATMTLAEFLIETNEADSPMED